MTRAVPCRCRETAQYLSTECDRHASDSHWAWQQEWVEKHPSRRIGDTPRYPVGTFHVEQRCLCRGNLRYFSVKCPDRATHGRHEDQNWYEDPPVFEEGYMAAAKEYHAAIMAEADPDGAWSLLRPLIEQRKM